MVSEETLKAIRESMQRQIEESDVIAELNQEIKDLKARVAKLEQEVSKKQS